MYIDKPPILDYYVSINDDETLKHYGRPQPYDLSPVGSGRYRKGSGENPNQRGNYSDFFSRYKEMHAQGKTDTEIARSMGITVSALRAKKSIASNEERASKINMAMSLKEHGYSNTEIAKRMNLNESSVRSLLAQAETHRTSITQNLADKLKENVDEKGFIDIGAGVEKELGVTQTRMKTATEILKEEGYSVISVDVPQVTQPGQFTKVKVLAPPGTEWADVRYNLDKIKTINEYSPDGGDTFYTLESPKSISSSRIKIRYAEEGGVDKDGVIELRRGVEDTSLGNSSYAQVRIAVDGTHYLKGMAIYGDDKDFPPGVDIIFNTNKSNSKTKLEVMKELKDDPDNPFGATIKAGGQRHYIDANGNVQLSVINKLKEEGDWEKYSKNLSSQFLSKQPQQLINQQLDLAYKKKDAEFKEILALTNPTVKKKLLESFANDCDAAAVDLKAAALPRQSSKVILPITTLKDNEIFAPTYRDGERVVLIRYPHGGTFEIPELTVNNSKTLIKKHGNLKDAVGINSKVAEKLSGADFDGDTVVVIPVNDKVRVKTSKSLQGLVGFDPKKEYPGYEGMKKMDSRTKGIEMGKVSNLITDMTLRGAEPDEIARAVRHSMVVIDAEKHGLNWKLSEEKNGIAALKEKYQGGKNAGASTLISKASSETRVPERKHGYYNPDPETGEKIFKETGRTIKKAVVDPETGKKTYADTGKLATQKSTKMAEVKDAYELSSGTKQENAYANYANKMKAMGNAARKEYMATPNLEYSPSAYKAYEKEVSSLNAKLNTALKNAPKERQAQIQANSIIKKKLDADPTLKDNKDDLKKVSNQALATSRARVGANKKDVQVNITDDEWKAIQAGAISNNTLVKILNNSDLDTIKKLATPRTDHTLSAAKQASIKNMLAIGYSLEEVADSLGVSTSTVSKYSN